jgi:hypothetical protein
LFASGFLLTARFLGLALGTLSSSDSSDEISFLRLGILATPNRNKYILPAVVMMREIILLFLLLFLLFVWRHHKKTAARDQKSFLLFFFLFSGFFENGTISLNFFVISCHRPHFGDIAKTWRK